MQFIKPLSKMLITFFTIVLMTVLAGCASTDIQSYDSIDGTSKTVTVPSGGYGLTGGIKKALSDRGWKLVVDRGPSVTEGSIGENTQIKQYDSFKTRYRLSVFSYPTTDGCITLNTIGFDISFVDNQTGSEVFTMAGLGCEKDAIEDFGKAIDSITTN